MIIGEGLRIISEEVLKKTKDQKTHDQQWMLDYINGNESAFHQIYKAYSSKVYQYLIKKCRDKEEAEEVFQKVFLKFHLSREQYDPHYPLLQWIYVITKSVLYDHYRSLKKDLDYQDLTIESFLNLSSDEVKESEREHLPEERLNQLTKEQRTVLNFKVFDELTYLEISKKINKSEVSIRKIWSRALKTLRSSS